MQVSWNQSQRLLLFAGARSPCARRSIADQNHEWRPARYRRAAVAPSRSPESELVGGRSDTRRVSFEMRTLYGTRAALPRSSPDRRGTLLETPSQALRRDRRGTNESRSGHRRGDRRGCERTPIEGLWWRLRGPHQARTGCCVFCRSRFSRVLFHAAHRFLPCLCCRTRTGVSPAASVSPSCCCGVSKDRAAGCDAHWRRSTARQLPGAVGLTFTYCSAHDKISSSEFRSTAA